MEFLRYILLFYSFTGILVAGGVLFNKSHKANVYLAVFILLFALEQLDFLYVTGSLLEYFPQYYMVLFPICLLFGPAIYFYVKRSHSNQIKKMTLLLHSIPFLFYFGFTCFLLTMSGLERLDYVQQHFSSIIMPLNCFKAFHVTIYGVMMVVFIQQNSFSWTDKKRKYIFTIITIYTITAVFQAYLTLFAERYEYFIAYFLLASTLVVFVAYVLYFEPVLLQTIQKKYFGSSLNKIDKLRIVQKINQFVSSTENITQSSISLDHFCKQIGEKKHHISQTLSEEFKTSFNDLINKNRIEYAKKILRDQEDLKILAVAIESGFRNKTTFNRAFSKFTDCTPSEFRKKTGNK